MTIRNQQTNRKMLQLVIIAENVSQKILSESVFKASRKPLGPFSIYVMLYNACKHAWCSILENINLDDFKWSIVNLVRRSFPWFQEFLYSLVLTVMDAFISLLFNLKVHSGWFDM